MPGAFSSAEPPEPGGLPRGGLLELVLVLAVLIVDIVAPVVSRIVDDVGTQPQASEQF